MTCEVRIQPTALQELERAIEYLLGFGPNTASTFLNEWESIIERLREGTTEHRLSRFEPLAKLGYHTVLMKNYVILYFKEEGSIVIAHLFHQSQDYAAIVLNGE